MFKKKDSLVVTTSEKPRGGSGVISITKVLDGVDTDGKIKILTRVVIPVGASIGRHQHVDDSEMYYVIAGAGRVLDDNENHEINVGDVLYTRKNGWHSIENIGHTELVFIALILH